MIPSFPKGASLDSILLACHWLIQSKTLQHSKSIFFGDNFRRISILAGGANVFAERALGGTISGRELAMQNSAWPIYSSLMPQPMADDCLAELLSSSKPAVWNKFIKPQQAGIYAQDWRSCPECCREDTTANGCGLGHWRVVHQLPGVTYCPKHLTPLQYRCSGCQYPLGGRKLIAMPAWDCLNCGCDKKDELQVNVTSGSKALVGLYVKLLSNEGTSLSPANRGKLHQKILGKYPEDDEIIKYINQFLATFEFSNLDQLGAFLNIKITMRNAYSAVYGGSSCPLALNLALSSFAINNTKVYESVPNEDEYMASRWSRWSMSADGLSLSESLEISEICRLAADAAIPAPAIYLWIQGASNETVYSYFMVLPEKLINFFKSLPIYLRIFLKLDENCRRVGFLTLKKLSKDKIRQYHRGKIKSVISSGAKSMLDVVHCAGESFEWCWINDAEWLHINVPRRANR